MQFGFSANAFREYGWDETIGLLASVGFDGVELLFDEPHLYPPAADAADVAAVEDALRTNGVEISNCNAFMLTAIEGFHHPSYIEPDPDYRRRRIDYTRAAVRLADALGVDYISIEPGGPLPEDKSFEWGVETFAESLRRVLPVAEATGVDLLIEPEPDLLIETSDQYLAFADRIDSPSIGCNFDAGHLYCVGEDPAAAVPKLEAHTAHYHLEDIPADRSHEHTQLGDGAMDVEGVLEAIEATGYDGYVTVELYPYRETAVEAARDAYAYLDERGWV